MRQSVRRFKKEKGKYTHVRDTFTFFFLTLRPLATARIRILLQYARLVFDYVLACITRICERRKHPVIAFIKSNLSSGETKTGGEQKKKKLIRTSERKMRKAARTWYDNEHLYVNVHYLWY